ncbi:MAG: ABC transporter ATP-binding protein [Pseudomonadota bacterium]
MMELQGLSKAFDGKPAIADVSLTVEDDEYLTLLGPSGSGKTTLLRLIAGLDTADAGRVLLNGEDITRQSTHLRGLGFVQQNYALFPHMTVAQNIGYGLANRMVDPVTDNAVLKKRVDAMLALVGLSELGERMVGQISGGQKQRVSLARTLITEPKVCLLDEPLGALDANLRERMTVELRRIRETLGVTFLHVTGNESEALAMGDRMIVLDAGRLLQIDPPDTVYDAPATAQVARYLNAYNILEGASGGTAFVSGAAALPLPSGLSGIGRYAIRFDAVEIAPAGAEAPAGRPALPARFIASEFLGSRVIYFFQRPEGQIIEVERHLSTADPLQFGQDEMRMLHWPAEAALLFGPNDRRIAPHPARGAA